MKVSPRTIERASTLPGDGIVPDPDVVMDRGFTLPAPMERVWPWFVQLGKGRAGWYLPRAWERLVPRRRRGLRHVDPALQGLGVGDIIPDWGGARATSEVAELAAPTTLVHRSRRGRTRMSWAIVLHPETGPVGDEVTRVHLRLRVGPVRRRRLAGLGGGLIDLVTIAGLAAGLRERVRPAGRRPG